MKNEVKIRIKRNEKEKRKNNRENQKSQKLVLLKDEIDKPLDRLTMTKRERTQVTKIRTKRRSLLFIVQKSKNATRECYEQVYVNKLHNLEKY